MAAILIVYGCGHTQKIDNKLDLAESLMELYPESALLILGDIEGVQLKDNRHTARFALLKSMALDKNCIYTTTFNVLQPAIDY